MKETEITVQVFNTLDEIKNKLNKLGFSIKKEYEINDFYYSKLSTNKLLNLSYSEIIKNSFIVRNIEDNIIKNKIVFKNKTLDKNNNVIAEEKISTAIDNLDNTLKIFSLTKINCWCKLNQKLIVYQNNLFEFAIQIIDDLGIFIEYEEDNSMKNLTCFEKINIMKNNLLNLGLSLGDDFSCKKVYMKFLKENS